MSRAFLAILAFAIAATATELDLLERFALAADRLAVVDELVPGSDEHFFFRCLALQHAGRLDEVARELGRWRDRHRRSARREEIRLRQLILTAGGDAAARERLAEELGLALDHQPPAQAERNLPTALDRARLDPERLVSEHLRRHGVGGFTDSGLEALLGHRLDRDQRRALLERLASADRPEAEALLVAELSDRRSKGFSGYPLAATLTADGLDRLAARVPALRDDGAWVLARLGREAPNDGQLVAGDRAVRRAWLKRLWAVADGLPAVHNSLKARILAAWLELDLAAGQVDRGRFERFLALPRRVAWAAKPAGQVDRRALVDPRHRVDDGIVPPTRLNDQELVRRCLLALLVDEASPAAWGHLVDRPWLERLFVEAKVVAGRGDLDAWYQRLDDPAFFQALRERVDLELAPVNPEVFPLGVVPTLQLDVKRVERLLVKVYRLDLAAWYRQEGREPDPALALDGLVANHERVIELDHPPLRRQRLAVELPECRGPGAWVVEFVGGGRACRALVRAGRLDFASQTTAAGLRLHPRDEQGAPLVGAVAWLDGRRFAAAADGSILVPFTDRARSRPVVVATGGRACRREVHHPAETWHLGGAVHLPREGVLPGQRLELLVVPRLQVAGVAAPVGLLEEPHLQVTVTDEEGVETTSSRGVVLDDGADLVHGLIVPAGARQVAITLSGTVTGLDGQEHELALAETFDVNHAADSLALGDVHLARLADGWQLELLGRAGEPLAGYEVGIGLVHRWLHHPEEVRLVSDQRGRVHLGALPGITRVTVQTGWRLDAGVGVRQWLLVDDEVATAEEIHLAAGEPLRLPHPGPATAVDRAGFRLVASHGGRPVADGLERLTLRDGHLVADLPVGTWELTDKRSGRQTLIRVAAADLGAGLVADPARLLARGRGGHLHITEAGIDAAGDLVVRLAGAGPQARVHVLPRRWHQADARALLGRPEAGSVEPRVPALAAFLAARTISDEERYVLDRRHQPVFAGNLLAKPSLLLNPWSPQASDWQGLEGGAGGGFGSRSGGGEKRAVGRFGGTGASEWAEAGTCYDFLAPGPAPRYNLQPDAEGVVRVPAAALAGARSLEIVASGPRGGARRCLALPDRPLATVSVALPEALDPAVPHRRVREVHSLEAGAAVVLGPGAEFRAYTAVSELFDLLTALTGDQELEAFRILGRWHQLDEAAKQAAYEDLACHEFHVFLARHDRPFFTRVVAPLLADKRHRTFLDHWLLGDDLAPFRQPWAFGQRNAAERALLLAGWDAGEEAEALRRDLVQAARRRDQDGSERLRRFRAALLGRALDEGAGGFALFGGADEAGEAESGTAAAPAAPRSPPPMAAMAGAAMADGLVPGVANEAREQARRKRLYQQLEPTRVWIEHDYRHLARTDEGPELILADAFWAAVAEAGPGLRSGHVVEAVDNRHEALLALALTDLPGQPSAPTVARDGAGLRVVASGPTILFSRRLVPEPAVVGDILVRAVTVDAAEPEIEVDGEWRLRTPERFHIHHPYEQRVMVANGGPRAERVEVLLQVPAGAVALDGTRTTRLEAVELEPYGSAELTLAFAFPAAGVFAQHPPTVCDEHGVRGRAEAVTWTVAAEPAADTASWTWLAEHGDLDAVLDHLASADLDGLDLEAIAWRLAERPAWQAVWEVLARRRHFDRAVWAYAFVHGATADIGQLLAHEEGLAERLGGTAALGLVTIDPVDRRAWQHREFAPLVNPRVHPFSDRPQVADAGAEADYRRLLEHLARRPRLDAEDRLALLVHWLMQDRIGAAIELAEDLADSELAEGLQFAYLQAWLALSRGDTAAARAAAAPYGEHPVPHWRRKFAAVLAQLDEIEGATPEAGEEAERSQDLVATSAAAPSLEVRLDGDRLVIDYHRLAAVEVRYHRVDVEMRFSQEPFAGSGDGAGSIALLAPHLVEHHDLAGDRHRAELPIAADLARANAVVVVRGGGRERTVRLLASDLAVAIDRDRGLLRVRSGATGTPRARAYVKVYGRLADGREVFVKDGYSDLRGWFDYASVSDPEAAGASRYAILVLGDEGQGAVIREVDAPAR